MQNPLPVILVVVCSNTPGFDSPGLREVQSWFCFGWLKSRGVVGTVIMMIEAIRKMLVHEPSPLVLHISPFFGLHSESSIPAHIDGWVETEGEQRGLQLGSAILLSTSVSSAFCHRRRWGQNMRFSGESSQRSCSRRKNSFANTNPPPRRTKNIRVLAHPFSPITALRTWKPKGLVSLASVLQQDPQAEEVDSWILYHDDMITLFISLVLVGKGVLWAATDLH